MTSCPRVLHVAQPVDGGVARVVTQVAADQVARGWDVVVACPDEGQLPHALRAAGVRVETWRGVRGPRAGTPARVRALSAVVARVDPDVVHLHSASAGLAGRLAVRGRRPTVFQPHGWSWQAVTGAAARGSVAWERLGQHLCRLIVCVSAAERDTGAAHGVRRRCEVLPNGVDLREFPARSDDDRADARRRLALADRPLVVCVGRLDLQKGQAVLVRAWPQVLRAVPDAVLALVGTGPEAEALRRLSVDLHVAESVLLPGPSDDVPLWYAAADVVAFSSLHGEAMALTPLEAQASARSLVASDVAGIRESCDPQGGAVVPPGDVGGFAEELSRRLLDPGLTAEEGRSARSFAEQRLDVARVLERLATLTSQLVRPPQGGR